MPLTAQFGPVIATSRACPAVSSLIQRSRKTLVVSAQIDDCRSQLASQYRRELILRSVNVVVLAEATLNQSDPRTVVNSLLGMIKHTSLQRRRSYHN